MYTKGQSVTVRGIAGVFQFESYLEFDDTVKAKLANGRIVELKDLSEYECRESCVWLH